MVVLVSGFRVWCCLQCGCGLLFGCFGGLVVVIGCLPGLLVFVLGGII